MYEYEFKNSIKRTVSDSLGMIKSHSILYDVYFIDFVGEEREIYLPTFLKDLLIPSKQGLSLVVTIEPVAPSFMEQKKVEISTTKTTE